MSEAERQQCFGLCFSVGLFMSVLAVFLRCSLESTWIPDASSVPFNAEHLSHRSPPRLPSSAGCLFLPFAM